MQEAETPTKTRRPRSDKGPRITERDLKALQWIEQQYAIRLDHLSILLAHLAMPGRPLPKQAGRITQKSTMDVVRRWEQMKLIERAWIVHGQPFWLWLSDTGSQLAASDQGRKARRSYQPHPAKLEHLYYTNLVRLFIEGRRPDAVWTSERQLAAQGGKTQSHRPDAVVLRNSTQIAIEVELTKKTRGRLEKILYELAQSNYHTVWYFSREKALTLTQKTIDGMQEVYKRKFAVYDLDNDLKEQGGNNTHAKA